MLLLSLQLPIPLLVMAVQLVLLKRMLVIPDQRMALDQGRTKPPIQWFISLHAHVFASPRICPAALIAIAQPSQTFSTCMISYLATHTLQADN